MSELGLHHIAIAAHKPAELAASDDSGGNAPILMIEPTAVVDDTLADGRRTDFMTKDPGLHLIAWRIATHRRDAWSERLRVAGVTVESESPFTIFFRDPEGNRVGLSHYPLTATGSRRSESP